MRVLDRPDINSHARKEFEAKGLELATAGLQKGNYKNPAGHRWVLLAMPGQSRDTQCEEAANYFHPPDTDSPGMGIRKVYLTSAEFRGVGVLAQAHLGSGLYSYADGSCGQTQAGSDFWTEPGEPYDLHVRIGCFSSPHQLLPICTILISDQDADQDGQPHSCSTPSKHGDSFSAPLKDCTDMTRDECNSVQNLVLQNSKLEKRIAVLKRRLKNINDAASLAQRRGRVDGCHQVTIAGQAVERSGLEGVDIVGLPAEAEATEGGGEEGAAKKRPRRVQGEVATEKLIAASTGGKAIRRGKSGKKIGGMEWKDTEVAGAVANWALNSLSFKAAGKTTNAGLRNKGVRFWFKAEPRRNYKTRRRMGPKNKIPVIPLVDVSTTSMRRGVFAMELAKNHVFYLRLQKADAITMCSDLSTVSDKAFQGTHIRTYEFGHGGVDGANTTWLIATTTSMVMDVWPAGDKMLATVTYEDEAGVHRELPVEAPRSLAAQLIYAGWYWIIMACRCLSWTFDGGGEGTGKGNKVRARETMAGENSYIDLVWLTRSAADSAFELLNNAGVFVPLMEFYGYDWESGKYLTRAQDSQSSLAPEVADPSPASHDLTGDPDCDAASFAAAPRIAAMRPIFDPLAGPSDSQQPRMSIFDFVPWDMARAHPILGLADTAQGLTNDMVGRTELFVNCLLDAVFENVIDDVEFSKVMSQESLKRLKPGVYVSSDAMYFVMVPMTLAMGGRMLMGQGGYMDEPPSPLIHVASDASKIHVLDTVTAAHMVSNYKDGKTTSLFETKRRLLSGCKAVQLGPNDTVFVGVHRPGHYVSMVVENLGALDDTSTARMTVADSLQSPKFDCDTHDALRMAFRQKKLIGKEHEVGHFGLSLPRQTLPDCAFYMLVYLATVLTRTFLPPELWGFLTRLMRCWTFFLVLRELLHRKAVLPNVWSDARTEYDRRMLLQPAFRVEAADTVGYTGELVSIDKPKTAAEDADRMEVAEKAEDQARRKLAARCAEAKSVTMRERASRAWKPMRRARPRQIDTGGEVRACNTPPICARGSQKSQDCWRKRYPAEPKTSMFKSPARYFPMVEQDQLHPVPLGLWCGRHRFHAWCKACSESEDRYPEIAEACVTCIRNPFIWPRLKAHMQAYIGTEKGLQADPIHMAVRKGMRLRVDRSGPAQGTMMIQDESDAPSFFTGLIGRMKKSIFTKPQVSAATRWGTQYEGQRLLGVNGRVFASGTIQATGDGTLAALQTAAAAPFQKDGFKVDGSIRTSAKLGQHLRCLTSQKLGFYHAFGRFLCVMGVRPILSAFSTHLECPASSVCGVGSFFRRFLRLVTEEMFVGLFNSADCNPKASYRNEQAPGRVQPFTGTSYKFDDQTRKKKSADRPHSTVKLAHRGWASLRGSHKTLFLLNPQANVQKMMGPFATTEMNGAVRALTSDLRRLSEMNEDLGFLPTLENRWKDREAARPKPGPASNWNAVVAAGKDKPVVNPGATAAAMSKTAGAIAAARYVRNMHKAQWAVREIMKDVVRATEKWFDHELYSLIGFLACMIQTRWVDVVKVATGEKMKILIAHEDAIPNGQVGSRIFDELQAQFLDADEKEFRNFYPPQLTDLLKDEAAMSQFPEFLRGDEMEGFLLLDSRGDVVYEDTRKKDADGQPIMKPVVPGPAPLWRFPELALRVLKLYFRQMSSNDVERVFSLVARGFRGGGKNVGYMCISSWCRRRDWVTGRFFGMEVNPEFLKVFGAARRLMRENVERFQAVFSVDINSSERRKRWRQQKDLPAFIRKGTRKFGTTNIVPSKKESILGLKKDSSKDPAAVNQGNTNVHKASCIKKQRMAAHLAAIKQLPTRRQRASATGAQNRKREKPGSAVHGPHQRSKRARLGSVAGGAAAAVRDSHSDGDHADGDDLRPDPGARASPVAPAAGPGAEADASNNQSPAASVTVPARAHDSGGKQLEVQIPTRSDSCNQDLAKISMQSFDAGAAVDHVGAGVGAHVSVKQLSPAAATAGGGEGGSGPDDAGAAAADSGPAVASCAPSRATGTRSRKRTVSMISKKKSDSHDSHPLVLEMQKQMDALQEEEAWQPSVRVQLTRTDVRVSAFGMKRPDGVTHVVRTTESTCTFNLVYDHEGDGCVKIIKILKTGPGNYMEYYFVYPSEKAIREAACEDDKTVVLKEANGIQKAFIQVGAKTLREKAEHWKRVAIHHCGDVLHKSADKDGISLDKIVGTIAWVTKETLDGGQSKLSPKSTNALKASLTAMGITGKDAALLAAKPIFLGCHFYERKPGCTVEDDDEDDDDDDSGAADMGEIDECHWGVRTNRANANEARRLRSERRALHLKDGTGDGGPADT